MTIRKKSISTSTATDFAYFSNFNPLLHRYSFRHIKNRQLLKTLREKEKLLVTSNFSFSHNVFYSIRYLCLHLSTFFDIISLFAVELGKSKIGLFGNGLNGYLSHAEGQSSSFPPKIN